MMWNWPVSLVHYCNYTQVMRKWMLSQTFSYLVMCNVSFAVQTVVKLLVFLFGVSNSCVESV
jgi:hypothetical protein